LTQTTNGQTEQYYVGYSLRIVNGYDSEYRSRREYTGGGRDCYK